MGRESRQARRLRERRERQKARDASLDQVNRKYLYGLVAIVAIVALAIGAIAFSAFHSTSSANGNGLENPDPPIHGIQCSRGEQLTYHVHAHLSIIVDGKTHYAPAYTGMSLNDCLFWLHVHNNDGVIHIEAPNKITPTLGDFFAVWKEPLSRTRVWNYKVKPGQTMRVIVDHKIYTGDPNKITLTAHRLITIEIGPPFVPQQNFTWGQL